MPTESELRARLHGDDPGAGRLDVDEIVRRARARRRPRAALAGGLGLAAAAAILVPIATLGFGPAPLEESLSAGSAPESTTLDEAGGASDSALSERASGIADACGAPVTILETDEASAPLAASLPATESESRRTLDIEVLLVNGGEDALQLELDTAPKLVLTRDGVVVGLAETSSELAPGAPFVVAAGGSFALPVEVRLSACADDGTVTGRAPAAGDYELVASLGLRLADSPEAITVATAPAPLRLG